MGLVATKTKHTLTQEIKRDAGMDNVTDELKEKARPKQAEMVEELKTLNGKTETNTILLDRLCSLNEEIIGYKEGQRLGDIKFRKKSNTSSLISISIALTALAISVTGVEHIMYLLNGLL